MSPQKHKPFEVIEGGKGTTETHPFACPWCGERFRNRLIANEANGGGISLDKHFRISATCGNNRNTNNPTQTKYQEPSDD